MYRLLVSSHDDSRLARTQSTRGRWVSTGLKSASSQYRNPQRIRVGSPPPPKLTVGNSGQGGGGSKLEIGVRVSPCGFPMECASP
jgi:hypothetical protein